MAVKDLATTLEDLIQQYNETPTYTPKTDEEIRAKAEGEYESYYDQLRLTAQQQQAQSDLALQQQAAGLQATYDKQREASRKNYAQMYSQADRQMLSRGMQRSSYAAQTLANISEQGVEAQQTIADQQAAAEGNIAAQRTQLAQQLAAQLAQYDASEAADVLNRIRELEDIEYERGMTNAEYRNSLSAQIYQILYQQERDRIEDAQWQQQFNESVRQFNVLHAQTTGGGSNNNNNNNNNNNKNNDKKTDPTDPVAFDWKSFLDALTVGGQVANGAPSTATPGLTTGGGVGPNPFNKEVAIR